MNKDEVLHQILQSDELPTLPTVASQLITLTSQEETTLADIANLVSKDISLSAKILKVSNSAFYSFPQQIGSIKQAVSILGTNAVRSLVLSFSFLTMRGGKVQTRFNFETFWEKSLASAVTAKLILDNVKGVETEEIFISGLLQNLGELILAKCYPEKYDEVLLFVQEEKMDIFTAQETVFGVNHSQVGTAVALNWGFPEALLLPIEYHHRPKDYDGKDATIRATVRAVYLSDLLINILYSDQPEVYHKQFRKEASSLLGLSSENIGTILDQVHTKVKEAGSFFNLKIKTNKSVQEILQEANIRLSLINLDYDQMNKQLIQAKIHLETLTRELEEKNAILDNLANIDGLTGVYNHRYFQNYLDQELSRAKRHSSYLSILLVDIDHFKKVNDNYGHQVGDFVLAEFAKIIQENIRQHDILARYGGEEFVVILPETESDAALIVAEKLRKLIEETAFDDGSEQYSITASFGQTCCCPSKEDNFKKDTLINQADMALYEAKEKGRNRVISFSPKKKWYNF